LIYFDMHEAAHGIVPPGPPPVCDADIARSGWIGNDLLRAALASDSKETIMADPDVLPPMPVRR